VTLTVATERPGSLRVVQDLERKIIDGTLPRGSRLVERTLCSEYLVSRNIVREALAKLRAQCLVDIVPGAGATVGFLTEDKIRDAYIFREAIESAAAEQCALRLNREQTTALVKCASFFGHAYDGSCEGTTDELTRTGRPVSPPDHRRFAK